MEPPTEHQEVARITQHDRNEPSPKLNRARLNFGGTVSKFADNATTALGERTFPDPAHIGREGQPHTPLDQLATVAAQEPTPSLMSG